ncbi:hypothetical protein CAEBREN_31821 [Caenorhabditis brenneri]|uniref:Uncharacterized protein n=1 Tax=Caenorhabditis brenneri TaxID=135651 RepID=G0NPX9_CAEBE|nr:hypothetical protein CAEBREN_31821 [Caenorhabditis brenneri]
MCFKSLTLLGLISLVALTGAKLRWKCELFDTSQETSTRTTFVEFVNGKPPEPSVTDPNDPQNPRTPRSTPKCRPRPKNGTIPQTTQTEKLVVQKNRNIIQSDVPGSSFSGGDVIPNIKYQRKETHQSLDLNIGPGFEESNDPYGKSKMPVPKRFRPAELKGADELEKPLAEHLDENVMPDFEFDDDDVPPVAEDLPWCPEETEVDCETADLDKLSISELVELKQRCESKVSAERFRLIENMIKTETNRGVEGIPDSDNKAPPTGNTNCSTSPSDLSEATLKKYREECPCEDDTSKMSEEEFEVFKKECLDPINGPGKPYLRKNGRCGASQKITDAMSEKEYKLFVKECLVQPNNIKLEKILIIENKPECTDVRMKGISKSEVSFNFRRKNENHKSKLHFQFSEFKKNCVTSKTCNDVDKSRLNEKELITFKKMCSPTTRKTNSICDERDVDGLDEEQFDRYMKECFLREEKNDCESVDLDSLSELEYEKYKERCQESPINCESVDPNDLTGIEYKMYQKECLGSRSPPPRVVSPIDCGKTNPDTLNRRDYEEYDSLCLKPMNCKTTNPDELTDKEYKRYQKKCLQKSASECAKINPRELTDEEYKKYEDECLEKEVNCTTADSREMTKEQYKRFEKVCLKSKSDCKDVDIKKLNDEEYEKFRKNCLKNPPKYDCFDVNLDVLTEEEYQEYKAECLVKELDCESIDQRKLTGKKIKKFQRECVKKTDNCLDVKVEDLTNEEYEEYVKKCLKERTTFDCETTDSRKLTRKQFMMFEKKCIESTPNCKNINPGELSDEEYHKYLKNCLKKSSNYNCSTINPDDLRGDELRRYQRECSVEEEFDCKSTKPDELSKSEYELFMRRCVKNSDDLLQYKKDCLDEEGNLNCDSIQSKKLTRTQFEQYEKKCLERKSSGNCDTINPDDLSDEEYENYKKNCLRKKTRFSCEDVNVDELNREEYKRYQKECSNKARRPDCDIIRPEELNENEYAKYKRECLDSPKTSSNCENAKINEMSEKQLQEYEEECLPKDRLSKDCDSINPKKLSDEEYEKYQRACLPSSSSDCNNVNINELTDEEFSKYKKKCSKRPSFPSGPSVPGENVEIQKTVVINTPGGGVSPDCERMNPDELSGREFEDYQSRCARGDKSVTITKKVIINNGTGGHEYSVVPPSIDNEGCEDVDVEKMTTYEYNVYKKYCKVNFEGEDCDEIRTDKLSDGKLRKYVDQCGLFCGIDRKEVLSREQRRVFEERCEGDSRELEKDCKDVVIENLGEINVSTESNNSLNSTIFQYGAFAEKCIEQINACSMLKSRRLVRKVCNEFRLKRKPHLHLPENPRCEDVDSENMTLEESRDYQKRCRKNQKNDCENVNVEELSEKEYSAYKERCEISRRNENCKDINVDELSREEYKKYLKKCGRTPSTETSEDEDCSVDVSKLSHKEFLSRTGQCEFTPDSIQKYCENINWKSVKRDAVKREMTYQGLKEQCSDEPSKDKMTPGNGKNKNCSNVEIEKLTKEEYLQYKKDCGSTRKTVKSECDDVDVGRLSDEEYREFMKKCGSPKDGPDYPDRPNREGCSDVKIEELTSEEYAAYKKRCMEPRNPRSRTPEFPDEDCSNIDPTKLSPSEYTEYRRNCKPRRKTPDCSMKDISQLSDEEYRIYQRECESEEVPGRRKGCENVSVRGLSNDEVSYCFYISFDSFHLFQYSDYIKRCGDTNGEGVPGESVKITKTVIINNPPKDGSIIDRPPSGPERKTPKPDCEDVNVDQLTKEEYLLYKKRCGEGQPGEPSVIIQKTVKIHENPPKYRYVPPGGVSPGKPQNFDDCSNVNIAKLTDDEYNEYRRLCKPIRKRSKPECEDFDVESLSEEELKEHDKKCPPTEYEEVPPPSEADCSDVKVEELDKEDFIAYKKRCGSPDHPPGSPDEKTRGNCDDVKVEDLTSEEYMDYKKRCLKNVIPRRPSIPDENCSRVRIDELTEKEYRSYLRRCPESENVNIQKTVVISKGCQNRNTDRMTKEEYQQYERECSRNPHIQLEKTVKIIETPREPKEEDNCFDVDTSRMNGEELAEYQKRCGYHATFQFNCNADVTKMSEEEFVKFRRACGKKSFDCDSTDVNSLSDKDYSRYLRECGKNTEIDCENAKVERMNADEYSEYKEKCKTITRKTTNDCDNVKVEELSTAEYEEYKKRCKPRPSPESSTPPTKLRRRVDCSIVDESMMSEEEYADFKNHCNVKVRTDRYRPGEISF